MTAHFTIQARDSWESNRYTPEFPGGGGDIFAIRIRVGDRQDLHGKCADLHNSTYHCSYVPEAANINMLYVELAVPGGIHASYYDVWGPKQGLQGEAKGGHLVSEVRGEPPIFILYRQQHQHQQHQQEQ